MRRQPIPLIFPLEGVDENLAFSNPNPSRAFDARNLISKDPRTGRMRGAPRPGMSKHLTAAIDAGNEKIADLVSLVDANPNIDYTAPASSTVEIETSTSTRAACKRLVVGPAGNVYALDGPSAITKFNPDLEEIYSLTVPTKDDSHELRAIVVDAQGRIFTGTSVGTKNEDESRLWLYRPRDNNKGADLYWEIQPGGYVKAIEVFNDLMWVAIDKPSTQESFLAIYNSLQQRTGPELVALREIPYPCNDLAVRERDGAIFTTHEPFADRGLNPKHPDSSAGLPLPGGLNPGATWTPADLDDAENRIWAWFDATNSNGFGNVGLEEGDEITRWFDVSGNGRHLYYDPAILTVAASADKPPIFREEGLSGLPGIRFDGEQFLASARNPSIWQAHRDQQKTTVPAYRGGTAASPDADKNSAFAMFIVCRPAIDPVDSASTVPRYLFSHKDAVQQGTPEERAFLVNKDDDDVPGTAPSANDQARPMYVDNATGSASLPAGPGPNQYPRNSNSASYTSGFDNPQSTIVIGIICDGGVDASGTQTTRTASMLWLDGEPIDRWEGVGNWTDEPFVLGARDQALPTNYGNFIGEVCEVLVLDRTDPDTLTADTVLSHNRAGDDSLTPTGDVALSHSDDFEFERIVGYLSWKWKVRNRLAAGHAHKTAPPKRTASTGNFFTTREAYINDANYEDLIDADQLLCKWLPGGRYLSHVLTNTSGTGYAVEVGFRDNLDDDFESKEVYTMGPDDSTGGSQFHARKYIDIEYDESTATSLPTFGSIDPQSTQFGIGFNFTGGATWSFADSLPKMAVDEFGGLYMPITSTGGASADWDTAIVWGNVSAINGLQLIDIDLVTGNDGIDCFACAIPPRAPRLADSEFPGTLATNTKRSEFVYLATAASDSVPNDNLPTIHKVRLLTADHKSSADDYRTITPLAVSNGSIYTFTTAAKASPTGSSSALDANAPYVESAVFGNNVFWVDGARERYYDVFEDEVKEWKSKCAGTVPERCRLIARAFGAIFLARPADNPNQWYKTATGNPFDFDAGPPVPNPAQAIIGSDSRAGASPDIVNSLAPHTQDELVFGCDSSLHVLRGDPAQGGRFDVLSESVGMAFGRPWAKDDRNNLYFYSSTGGVWVRPPYGSASDLVELSEDRVSMRMRDVDLTSYYVRMAWDTALDGLWVMFMPFGAATEVREHFFWQRQTGAWWPIQFGLNFTDHADVQPTALYVLDGDRPADRRILVGCNDSQVRYLDSSADNDDTNQAAADVPLDRYVVMGPLQGPSSGREYRFSHAEIQLAHDRQGCRLEYLKTNDAGVIGSPVATKLLRPGQNSPMVHKMRGNHCYLRLRSVKANESFAWENGSIQAAPGGRVRAGFKEAR